MAQPEYSVKVGAISVAVWVNKGDKFDTQNITVLRAYKKGDNWETTTSLRFQDIALVKLALDKVFEWKYLKDNMPAEKEF